MKILSEFMHWDNLPQVASSNDKFFTASNDLSCAATEGEGLGDEEVLQKLFSASNGLANLKLYNGDTSKYNDDQSAADLAFVNSIAFYTQLPEQIDNIFRQSNLVRDKWDEQHSSTGETYGEMTINKALGDLDNTYSAPRARQSSRSEKSNDRAFRLISGREIIDRPIKTDWLIEDFIPSDTTVMLFGEPTSGKSLIALEMACCIASGHDWTDKPVKQGEVAYIAGEGFHGLSKRLNALVQEKGLSVDHLHCSTSSMDLMHSGSVDEVMNTVKNIDGLELIIIDTLHRNFTGDESSSRDFAIVLKHCDQLRSATGATIMLVHHSGHKSSDRGRGSSSMNGAMDAEFKISKKNKVVEMECKKMKDDELSETLKFNLESVTIGEDEKGKAITAPILNKSTTFFTAENSSATLNQTDKLTLDLLTQLSTEYKNPVSKVDWKAACMEKYAVTSNSENPHEAKRKKFNRSLISLIKKGVVVEGNGCFTVTDPDTTTGEDD